MKKRNANRTGRNDQSARHVRLYHWLLTTDAWRSLDTTARAMYVELASRYAGVGSNNGRLAYSVRDAAKNLGIGKTTAARTLTQLQDRGFIVPMVKGHFDRKVRHATEWRLTEFPCDVTHAIASKEFTRWRPEIQNTVPPQTSKVPETEPNGVCTGTGVAKISRYGT